MSKASAGHPVVKKLQRSATKSVSSAGRSDTDAIAVDSDAETNDTSCNTEDEDPVKALGMHNFHSFYYCILIFQAEAAKRTWRSPIYSFFKDEISIGYEKGRLYHFFPCAARRCKNNAGGVRRYQDKQDKHSTANLKHHATRCFGEDTVKITMDGGKAAQNENGSIFQSFARRGQEPVTMSHRALSTPKARALITKWVAENNRPATIVEDRELIKLLTGGRPQMHIPSALTVTRDIKTAFEACRNRIKKLLQDHPGRLHFATDAWTSPNQRAFVAWTVHLEHEGQMLTFLLDIVEVPESHTGDRLAQAFQKVLVDFGIQHKILCVASDNASSNETQTAALATLDNSFDEEARVRCFNHTMSLAAKELLKPFNPAFNSRSGDLSNGADDVGNNSDDGLDEMDDEDGEGNEQDDVIINDEDDNFDELEELGFVKKDELIADTAAVRSVVSKVRFLIPIVGANAHDVAQLRSLSFAIIRSTTLSLPQWMRLCLVHTLKEKRIPRDVVTRWNSTYDMLNFMLLYREPIDAITGDKTYKLRQFELLAEEWKIVENLVSVLKQFKQATLFFSQNTASVAAVIPAMDRLTSGLDPQTNLKHHPAIIAALKLARNKLNRYYSLTDGSTAYRIAMVLHPGLKLAYFRCHEWDQEWIEQAEALTRDEYKSAYENKVAAVANPSGQADPQPSGDFMDFGNLSVAAATPPCELDEYLRQPVEAVSDPLKWWHNHKFVYPNLYRMGLDFLSIPGMSACFDSVCTDHCPSATSTAVERVFSLGRHLLPYTRNRMSGASFRASLCLGSWCRHDLISVEDIEEALKERLSLKRKWVADKDIVNV